MTGEESVWCIEAEGWRFRGFRGEERRGECVVNRSLGAELNPRVLCSRVGGNEWYLRWWGINFLHFC